LLPLPHQKKLQLHEVLQEIKEKEMKRSYLHYSSCELASGVGGSGAAAVLQQIGAPVSNREELIDLLA
jgi:hypothetical protein